jgi:dTDP-4-dehydrorhamnose reductase
MRALLIGADGMLGRAWAALLRSEAIEHDTVVHPAVDFTRPQTLDAIAWDRFDTVINCAAWTDVDGAEAHEAEATAVNGAGARAVAERRSPSAVLVHYSTDYVFSGAGAEPYRVDAPLQPVNAYGRSKAAGEQAVREVGGPYLVLRTSWLYAPWGHNFVRTMVKLGRERSQLRVVDDQRGRPTSAQHLARASLALLRRSARGTLHVTDGGSCTWYELARATLARAAPSCRVDPCTTAEFPRPAERPAYSVLDLAPTEAILGPMPPWPNNLAAVLDQIE